MVSACPERLDVYALSLDQGVVEGRPRGCEGGVKVGVAGPFPTIKQRIASIVIVVHVVSYISLIYVHTYIHTYNIHECI